MIGAEGTGVLRERERGGGYRNRDTDRETQTDRQTETERQAERKRREKETERSI